ncbi:hypothetical protein HKX48_007195, partial [Thoreauomyces humboldtii]
MSSAPAAGPPPPPGPGNPGGPTEDLRDRATQVATQVDQAGRDTEVVTVKGVREADLLPTGEEAAEDGDLLLEETIHLGCHRLERDHHLVDLAVAEVEVDHHQLVEVQNRHWHLYRCSQAETMMSTPKKSRTPSKISLTLTEKKEDSSAKAYFATDNGASVRRKIGELQQKGSVKHHNSDFCKLTAEMDPPLDFYTEMFEYKRSLNSNLCVALKQREGLQRFQSIEEAMQHAIQMDGAFRQPKASITESSSASSNNKHQKEKSDSKDKGKGKAASGHNASSGRRKSHKGWKLSKLGLVDNCASCSEAFIKDLLDSEGSNVETDEEVLTEAPFLNQTSNKHHLNVNPIHEE